MRNTSRENKTLYETPCAAGAHISTQKMQISLDTSWLWAYLHSIGSGRVLGASGTVIDGVPRVTAGLVARQLEEGPVVLAEVQLVLLLPHEAVLALGDQAAQGLGVQGPQLAVHPLLAVDVAQQVVEAGG